MIIHNDGMPTTRQRSNVAHELGHIFLEHDHPPINVDGDFTRDAVDEAEANWFGFALLVPAQAATHLAHIGFTVAQAAELFGVSEDLMRMRLDVTGARKRFPQRRCG